MERQDELKAKWKIFSAKRSNLHITYKVGSVIIARQSEKAANVEYNW